MRMQHTHTSKQTFRGKLNSSTISVLKMVNARSMCKWNVCGINKTFASTILLLTHLIKWCENVSRSKSKGIINIRLHRISSILETTLGACDLFIMRHHIHLCFHLTKLCTKYKLILISAHWAVITRWVHSWLKVTRRRIGTKHTSWNTRCCGTKQENDNGNEYRIPEIFKLYVCTSKRINDEW